MPPDTSPAMPTLQARRLQGQTVEGYWLTPCIYCGMTATERDHFVPRSWRRLMKTWREGVWKDAPDTVPSCRECNGLAGAMPFETIVDKRAYIKAQLRDKYIRLLASPFHSEEELSEYGKNLRSHIEKRETQRLRLILRLAWPYDPGGEIEAMTRYLYEAAADPSAALNRLRRREILES